MAKPDKAGLQLVIRHMIRVVGKSFAEVSRAIGRNSRYIPTMLKDATTPGLDLFVKIANACGYDVLLVGHGEAHRLAAERIGEAKVSATRLWSVESASVDGASVDRLTLEPVEAQESVLFEGIPYKFEDFDNTWDGLSSQLPQKGGPSDN